MATKQVTLTQGTTSWTVPSDFGGFVSVECWGAGGGGGGTELDDNSWANGGSGGGYSKTTIDPGWAVNQVVSMSIPSGGSGGIAGNVPGQSKNGGTPIGPTWIGPNQASAICLANCGQGGLSGANTDSKTATPGASTTGAIGQILYAGGNGGFGTGSGVGTGGGSAGPDGPGGAGSTQGDSSVVGGTADGGTIAGGPGTNGTSSSVGGSGGGGVRVDGSGTSGSGGSPGGGGCGGFIWSGASTDGVNGGAGGNGQIVITYAVASVVTPVSKRRCTVTITM